jgi:hypothetical protein
MNEMLIGLRFSAVDQANDNDEAWPLIPSPGGWHDGWRWCRCAM